MPPKRKETTTDDGEPGAKKGKTAREQIPEVDAASLASEAKTTDGKKWNLKIASWNINGIKAWNEKNGQSYIKAEDPDVICVQEIKSAKEKIPKDVEIEGYHTFWYSAEKEGYAGTGLYTKQKPIEVKYGLDIPKHDDEGRVITAEFEKYFVVTTYVPNSGRGLPRLDYRTNEWDTDFFAYLKELDKKKPVVMCGDLNVAHLEIDLKNPKGNKKTAGFTKEERESFGKLLDDGFVDSFRHLYPDVTDQYSFWTYMGNARAKNVGWRLDYFIISERLKTNLCDSVIRQSVMGSDHCPIVLFLNI